MFKLPNNIKIDDEGVAAAMADLLGERLYFLDTANGQVGVELINNENKAQIEKLVSNKRYFKIPTVPLATQISWLREFMADDYLLDDRQLRQNLQRILSDANPIKSAEEVFKKAGDAWQAAWDSWYSDSLFEEIKEWYASLPINIQEDFEYFDDCPICQAMKEGRTSYEELKDAFREAKEQGHIVGGEMFKEEENKGKSKK